MNDDSFCLFLILTCMTTLAVPGPGQIVVAVFGLVLVVLAHCAAKHADTSFPGHTDHRGIEPQRHAG
jgi:hypothetical protein